MRRVVPARDSKGTTLVESRGSVAPEWAITDFLIGFEHTKVSFPFPIVMDPTTRAKSLPKPERVKRRIWLHVHFWIGWISGIPIAVVCLTGAILAFSENITHWEYPELFQIEASGPRLSIAQVLHAYENAEPRYQVNHLGIPESPNHAYKAYCVQLHPEGRRNMQVYCNPYTGELTSMVGKFSIVGLVTKIHRNLVGAKVGQSIVALSSLLLAITCIFGLMLWVPLRARTFARVWKRGGALDWHNALGLIAMLPLILMALTGITFTWGRQIFHVLDRIRGAHSGLEAPVVHVSAGAIKMPFQDVADRVGALLPGNRITGVQPSNSARSPIVFFMDGERSNLSVYMDPYTGEVLRKADGSEMGIVGWYRSNFGRLHTFVPYGSFLRSTWAIFSMFGTILAATGLWVSIKRWRQGK